jgi:hypothetical protein
MALDREILPGFNQGIDHINHQGNNGAQYVNQQIRRHEHGLDPADG